MTRSQLQEKPEYFDRYINLCDDVEILRSIETSITELDKIPLHKWKAIGTKVYAPEKWTLGDILQHIIDVERIFTYRALAFARDTEHPLHSFDQDIYSSSAEGKNRTIDSLINELRLSHLAFKALFESFTPAMLGKMCVGFKGKYSVASVGFIVPGHQRWHLRIIEERYLPLLNL